MSVYLNEICLFSGDTLFVYKLFRTFHLNLSLLVQVHCDSSKISLIIQIDVYKQIKRSLIQQVKLYFRNNSLPLHDDKKNPHITTHDNTLKSG